MFLSYELLLSFRYLRLRRGDGFLHIIVGFSVLGIALSTATLIVVMSVMNGFHTVLLERILGINGHVIIYGSGSGIYDYSGLKDRLSELDFVSDNAAVIEKQSIVLSKSLASGSIVRGITAEGFSGRKLIADNLVGDNASVLADENNIFMGHKLARRLGVAINDKITIIAPNFTETAFGGIPRMRDFFIAAVFDTGIFQYDNNFIFMNLNVAQRLFDMTQRVSYIEVFTTRPEDIEDDMRAISSLIGDGYFVSNWQRNNAEFFNALRVERNVMFLILTLLILISAFNIISILVILVKDKSSSIAVLRSLGASRISIMRIFFLCGMIIGVIGTSLGVILGVIFSLNVENLRQFLESVLGVELFAAEIYYLSLLPSELRLRDILLVCFLSLFLSFIASVYPSRKAAKLNIAHILRHG